MSFFISSMLPLGLRSSPPESKHTPLPTRVTGARPADGVDRGIVLLEELIAQDDRDPGLVCACQPPGSLGQLGRPHVAGRRVDQVAHQAGGRRRAADPGAVRTLGPDQGGEAPLVLLIAAEGIAAERPTERHFHSALRRQGRVDPVDAFRQGRGQAGAGPGPFARVESGQDTLKRAVRPGQQAVAAGIGGEAGIPGPSRDGGGLSLEPAVEFSGGQRRDRHGTGPGAGRQVVGHEALVSVLPALGKGRRWSLGLARVAPLPP
jgi:hypothetical protein